MEPETESPVGYGLGEALENLKLGYTAELSVREDLTLAGVARLANRVKGNRSLKKLYLNNCGITDEHALLVSYAMPHCLPLRTLILGQNLIGANGARCLLEASLLSTNLQTLSLYDNKLGDEGAKLVGALLPSVNLVFLDLGKNNIGDSGAEAIAQGLTHSRLADLLLADNQITDKSCESLANSLKANAYIESLGLENNPEITARSVYYLFQALFTHRSMKNVKLTPGTAVNIRDEQSLGSHLKKLHSKRTKLMVMFCAAREIDRLGKNSSLNLLPIDIIRSICDCLVFDDHL